MKDTKRFYALLLIALFAGVRLQAQDHMYSQFFNSPNYLNPALNGQFEGDLRMNLIYRNQYSSVAGGGLTYLTASIDYNVPRFGGGFGLMFTRGSEGTAYLTKNNISGIYSYSIGNDDFVLSFGLQAGVTNRAVDYTKLIFSDQIDPRLGYIPGSVSGADAALFNNKFFFDSGAGLNLTAGNFNIGGAVQHINRPNESFTGVPAKLPMRGVFHASYRYNVTQDDNLDEDQKSYIIPSVVFYKQSQAQSLSVGFQYKRRSINAGLWYRSGGLSNGPSSIVVSFIFDLFINHEGGEKMRLGVSHDVPSGRGLNYSNTSGTTEGSIGYETTLPYRSNEYRKFNGARRCYDFY
ncbi:PorP/SprF family type IX secretion system membrane protein [Mucilaginibacter psychrotolerans]|uniref:Type IX secretion system membrane protein PorP/SprF n=1 Tax=Mucilaginibacter psychrotolerans TaxID=1524096 RepID=A0A4Y8S7N6_9SPHI|nr:PorP/SprF family type IX secretion system membrane protein [Mucilaginibacter psychrotolerans]TFF34932.1 type IX secretion system membrane protein PorP/SprF [Mucilaginibacter psychrotolerans]